MTKKQADVDEHSERIEEEQAPTPAEVKLCPRCVRLGRRVPVAKSGPAAKAGLCEGHYRQVKGA